MSKLMQALDDAGFSAEVTPNGLEIPHEDFHGYNATKLLIDVLESVGYRYVQHTADLKYGKGGKRYATGKILVTVTKL